MENLETNQNLYKDKLFLLSLTESKEVYSIDKIKGIICGSLEIDIDEINNDKLYEAINEYFLSLNSNILFYPAILRLSSSDTNRYFISKIAEEKKVITKEDVKKYLRCLPLEKRIACIKCLNAFFGKEDSITMENPEELYILNNSKTYEFDRNYVVDDNLEDFAVSNKYVNYTDQKSRKKTFSKVLNTGVERLCSKIASVLPLTSNDNLIINDQAINIENSQIDSASDDELLEWVQEAMENHYQFVDISTLDYIRKDYDRKIHDLHLNIILKYREYIKAVAPEYYNNLVCTITIEDVLNMAREVWVFNTETTGYKEHEAFINSVKIFNNSLLNIDDRFENSEIYTNKDKYISLIFKS